MKAQGQDLTMMLVLCTCVLWVEVCLRWNTEIWVDYVIDEIDCI